MSNIVVWLVMLPLAASLIAFLFARYSMSIGLLTGIGQTILAGLLLQHVNQFGEIVLALGGWESGLAITLRADSLAAVFIALVALLAVVISYYARCYFSQTKDQQRFWPLWLMIQSALYALFVSGDLFNIYVTLELLGLAAVSLAAFTLTKAALAAALQYLVLGLLGSLLFLLGVVFVYIELGTLDLLALETASKSDTYVVLAIVVMSLGLLVKSALFPMHFWLPPAHANAAAPISALLSALVIKAGVYLFMRLWIDVFADAIPITLANVLGILGGIAVIVGSWLALRAHRLKLMAAYSTVAQLGYFFLFFPLIFSLQDGAAKQLAFAAMLMMIISHGFAKSALFLAAGVVQQHAGHDRIQDMAGIARELPVIIFTIALAGVALIGLPPSGAFLAKWHLLSGAISANFYLIVIVIAAGSLLAAAYVFRVLGHAFRPNEAVRQRLYLAGLEIPTLLLSVIASVILGLFGSVIWHFMMMADVTKGVG